MFLNLKNKLKKMGSESLTQAEKNILWSKIEKGIESGQKQPSYFQQPSMFFNFSRKLAFASFLIFVLVGGSAATVIASNNAKPGDTLFPIDIAAEKIQLIFSSNKKKGELRIKFAWERLNEVKIILALAGENGSDENDAPATSTSDQTTTSTESETTTTKVKEFKSKDVKGTNIALTIALEHLRQTKSDLEEENSTAVEVIDGIIEELTMLAENYVSDLDKFKVEIKDNGNKLKIDIKTSSDELKTRFKFNQNKNNIKIELENHRKKDNDQDNDEEDEEEENEDNSRKVTICHIPPGNPDNSQTINVANAALQAHLAHGDTLNECSDEDDDTATSTPDTTAPVISNLVSSAATSTAEISWDTDETSNSKVWYSTTTPLVISSTTSSVSSTSLITNHTISLLNLTASTTYYFIVVSVDETDNSATSTESSFTTLEEIQEPVDTTPPVIANITATSTTATSTIISWKTDEVATSKVWYELTSPITISTSTPLVENSTILFDHLLQLTELTASSTYYFIVASTDVSGNTATSNESSFVTLPE